MIWLLAALIALQSPALGRRRPPSIESKLEGSWEAVIGEACCKTRLLLRIAPRERYSVTVTFPDTTRVPRPASAITYSPDGEFRARFETAQLTITGQLRTGNASILADVQSDGLTHRTTFRRVPGPAGPPRPQTPAPPFPYDSYNVGIDTGSGVLAATLTLPPGRGPFPAAVLLSGTGADDRDGSFAGHRPFLVIADYLTRRGFATLRFDDRGAGQSSGLFGELRTVDANALDAVAAVRFLQQEPGVDARRVGIIGHSEGGMVAAVAASQAEGISFLVLLGAPAIDGISSSLLQHEAIGRARGGSETIIALEKVMRARVYEVLRTERDETTARAAIAGIVREVSAHADPDARAMATRFERAVSALLARRYATVFRQRLTFDPAPALRAIRVPALALFASLDVQVPARENAPPMRDALAASSPLSEVRTLDGLNHAFQTAGTGAVEEYGRIEETFAPSALQVIGAWLKRVAAKK